MNTLKNSKAGRDFGITGFIVSLVALALWFPIMLAGIFIVVLGVIGLYVSGLWLAVSLTGLIFSILGLVKANNCGGKNVFATIGLMLGLLTSIASLVYLICLILALQ